MNRAKPVLDARRPWSFIKARSMYHLRDLSDTRFGVYGRFICSISATPTGQDDLARIITSVNAHDDLVAACKAALRGIAHARRPEWDETATVDAIRSALAKVGEL